MQSKVIDRDMGYKAFKRSVSTAGKRVVVVGILSGEIASYATHNEFGAPAANIPSRPFMRATFDAERQWIQSELVRQFARRMLSSRDAEFGALVAVGLEFSNKMKRSIHDWRDPPNMESTIEQKGANNPLVDTGAMQAAVTFEVRRK